MVLLPLRAISVLATNAILCCAAIELTVEMRKSSTHKLNCAVFDYDFTISLNQFDVSCVSLMPILVTHHFSCIFYLLFAF